MKKKLFGIFIIMFSFLSVFLVSNSIYAQGCSCEGITGTEELYKCLNDCASNPEYIPVDEATASDVGIDLTCLTGMCKGAFDYKKVLGIQDDQPNITAKSIIQDAIFAATYLVGTVLMIVIVYCGLMYIFAARGGKNPSDYKKGLISAGIGALLVRGGYAIVRLIQYIARG